MILAKDIVEKIMEAVPFLKNDDLKKIRRCVKEEIRYRKFIRDVMR